MASDVTVPSLTEVIALAELAPAGVAGMELPCAVALELLQSRLDGLTLGPEAAALLDGHIQHCPTCRDVASVAALPPLKRSAWADKPDIDWRVRAIAVEDQGRYYEPTDIAYMVPLNVVLSLADATVRLSHAILAEGAASVVYFSDRSVALRARQRGAEGFGEGSWSGGGHHGGHGIITVPWNGGPSLLLDLEASGLPPFDWVGLSPVTVPLPPKKHARPVRRYAAGPWVEVRANRVRLIELLDSFITRTQVEVVYDPEEPLGWAPRSALPAVLPAMNPALIMPLGGGRSVSPDDPSPLTATPTLARADQPMLVANGRHCFGNSGSVEYRRDVTTIRVRWNLAARWGGPPHGVELPAPVLWRTFPEPVRLPVSPGPLRGDGVQPVGQAFELPDGLQVVVHHSRGRALYVTTYRHGRPTDEPLALATAVGPGGSLRQADVVSRFPGGTIYSVTVPPVQIEVGRSAHTAVAYASASTAPLVRWSEMPPFEVVVAGVGRILPALLLPVGPERTGAPA